MSNEAGDKKNRSRRRSLFIGSKSPGRDIDNLTSNSSRRQSYESTSKIEPVAINIYRAITKCLAFYGLFKKFLLDSKFKRISF